MSKKQVLYDALAWAVVFKDDRGGKRFAAERTRKKAQKLRDQFSHYGPAKIVRARVRVTAP